MSRNPAPRTAGQAPEPVAVPAGAAVTSGAPVRVVTAAALFDGHDAAINMIRRLLVQAGAEVVHLGHNRSARDIADAAIQEDADAVAVSSYQGGHNEFFPFLRSLLDNADASDVHIFAGGGGVILPQEVRALEESAVDKVFTPEDGRELGLDGMIQFILDRCAGRAASRVSESLVVDRSSPRTVARAIRRLELGFADAGVRQATECLDQLEFLGEPAASPPRVLGVTGTGGAGKSSLVDELVLRFRRARPGGALAILAVDPSKRKTGGALLGDRLRMNSVYGGASGEGVFLHSLATRERGAEVAPVAGLILELYRRAGYEQIIVETAGIGQGASSVLEVSDISLYVMTSDFGGPTQLEKIDMLDFADLVAVNKSDRRGSDDALREVTRHVRRTRGEDQVAVFATCASRFNDPGVSALFEELGRRLGVTTGPGASVRRIDGGSEPSAAAERIIPLHREHYLSEAAATLRAYHAASQQRIDAYRDWERLDAARRQVGEAEELDDAARATTMATLETVAAKAHEAAEDSIARLREWRDVEASYCEDELSYEVRGVRRSVPLWRTSLAGTRIPRVALPRQTDGGEILRFLDRENLPGNFPYTAGIFPLKRDDEFPTRQFAGEGPPERTNRRFHLLTEGQAAQRLSVAFDSVTLYGADPAERPDIYGKIGESGVSIATLDNMKRLFEGFDLCSPSTSVSMTINGPAPMILAMFFNTAIDQQIDAFRSEKGREPSAVEVDEIRQRALSTVRGTVQADILKEDQAQNTCIFSTAFALRMMGDVQQFFIDAGVRNFYSVSVSGYHIAEAGANPITQLAFTLANGLTYVEYYRSRGMDIDGFAPNLSFFFSNGLDPEYAVLGRVARRIWAVVLRDLYGANARSQRLKYHIQTSGRSLHAREMTFNDIRTTLQALLAIYDNCNSLHTNAYDEAVTTPTAESVRRALAIQLIIQRELGLARNENPLQGSFIIEELTDLVEEAVLAEFDRISERGGVLGAMEGGYLRSRIQEESLLYEDLKHRGEIEIVGVNTFLGDEDTREELAGVPAVRATEAEKSGQIERLTRFRTKHDGARDAALARLVQVACEGGNIFAELLQTVRVASLGEITQTLFEVGGQYRRSM